MTLYSFLILYFNYEAILQSIMDPRYYTTIYGIPGVGAMDSFPSRNQSDSGDSQVRKKWIGCEMPYLLHTCKIKKPQCIDEVRSFI